MSRSAVEGYFGIAGEEAVGIVNSVPLSLSGQFIQQVTFIVRAMTGYDEAFLRRMVSLQRSDMSIES